MSKYLLKAETKNMGTLYYMNVICVTEQPECAMFYRTEDAAKKDIQYFKNLVRDDSVEIQIVDMDTEIANYVEHDVY